MAFNVDKCNVMHITRARTTKKHPYVMHDQQLEIVTETKYLGITISNNLSWNNHINNIERSEERCSCSGDVNDIPFIHVKCHFPLSFPFNKLI
jgi:hypothetical protein